MTMKRVRIYIYVLIGVMLAFIIGREPFRMWTQQSNAQSQTANIPVRANNEPRLCLASAAGDVALVKDLLNKGGLVDKSGEILGTPLEAAASHGHREVVRVLLEYGANPIAYRNHSVLNSAIDRMPDLVPDLLKHGAQVNDYRSEITPLCCAISRRNRGVADILLRHGAEVNPMHVPRMVYIQGHAVPDGSDDFWQPHSPLTFAAFYAPELMDPLLKLGANLGADKDNILVWAARNGKLDAVQRLVNLGADVNGVSLGDTPIGQASRFAPNCVPYLLEHDAKPDVVTRSGQTPLEIATIGGNKELVRMLLAHGASANFHPTNGHTPLYYAHQHQFNEIIALLQHAGGTE